MSAHHKHSIKHYRCSNRIMGRDYINHNGMERDEEEVKKVALLILLLITAVSLIACEFQEQEIYYNGQLRPVSQVEEIIADELEVENPDMDLEISIYEEEEDD